jgi:polysaccharide biosynthesis protein PslH
MKASAGSAVVTSSRRERLAFISTMFLQPEDTGGRIRTSNTLRGLKGGRFEVTLLAPADATLQQRWSREVAGLCDHFVAFPPLPVRPRWRRALDLWGDLPVSVTSSVSREAAATVEQTLREQPFDVVVFDFVHATPLMPARLDAASVCFTHNVETEIFDRHAQKAGSAWMRRIWSHQARKMRRFEREALARYDGVVAVSERDATIFGRDFGCRAAVIPTGVDLDFFAFLEPTPAAADTGGKVVFTGSMDWAANIDGIAYFLELVWPRVLAARPDARFEIVGRSPPASLLKMAESTRGVNFTGRVEDVRPHVRDAQVFVIPLRVGGGTRIKAFEAMAMGCPMVSTALGVEGLEVVDGEHLLVRDEAASFADAVVSLLADAARARTLAVQARALVQSRFSHKAAAAVFEDICWDTLQARRNAGRSTSGSSLG